MATAYKVSFLLGELVVTRTSYPKHRCVNPKDAVSRVRGGDMVEFREIWEALV